MICPASALEASAPAASGDLTDGPFCPLGADPGQISCVLPCPIVSTQSVSICCYFSDLQGHVWTGVDTAPPKQRICKPLVGGSNPSPGTNQIKHLVCGMTKLRWLWSA